MYSLYDAQRRGDSGGMSMAIKYVEDSENLIEHDSEPRVGYVIRVGSIYARTYSAQDWWQTSLIEEIVSDDTDDEKRTVVFKTHSGTTYTWIHRF